VVRDWVLFATLLLKEIELLPRRDYYASLDNLDDRAFGLLPKIWLAASSPVYSVP